MYYYRNVAKTCLNIVIKIKYEKIRPTLSVDMVSKRYTYKIKFELMPSCQYKVMSYLHATAVFFVELH